MKYGTPFFYKSFSSDRLLLSLCQLRSSSGFTTSFHIIYTDRHAVGDEFTLVETIYEITVRRQGQIHDKTLSNINKNQMVNLNKNEITLELRLISFNNC